MAEKEKQLKTTFTGVTLKSFTRNGKEITAALSANLTEKLCEMMGWRMMADKETAVSLEGKLAANVVTLNGAGTLSNFSVDIDAQSLESFEGVRREIENKKGKGFRHELHFKIKSADSTGCRDLEKFILSIPEGKGTCIVMHAPTAPKQGELDVTANAEAAQATLAKND